MLTSCIDIFTVAVCEGVFCFTQASTTNSETFLLQIILAFGNYMNSGKRGGVYGFKLQSLDMVIYLWLYIVFTQQERIH